MVHIGGAGLTLPRYVAATRPSSAQVVFEPDIELTAFVRTHLPLPARSGIKVRGVDGRSGVAELRDGYADVLIVDAFVGPRTPAELTTVEFWTDARRALSDTATMIVNLTDRGPLGYARRVLAGLATVFPSPAADGRVVHPQGPPVRQRHPRRVRRGRCRWPTSRPGPAGRRSRTGCCTGRGSTQLLAGARPFTDQDAEASPAPPRGMLHFG